MLNKLEASPFRKGAYVSLVWKKVSDEELLYNGQRQNIPL